MEKYFRVHPQVPPELGAEHGQFLLRLELPSVQAGHQLILTLGSAPPEADATSAVLLDLYDTVKGDSEDPFGSFERLLAEAHAEVERAFENAITPESRVLFQEIRDAAGPSS